MATTITANGINFPDGSASAPSIGGTDTNTGLFTGSDIVGFATGGEERIRIDSSGRILVGTISHKSNLNSSADASGQLAQFVGAADNTNKCVGIFAYSGTSNPTARGAKLQLNRARSTDGSTNTALANNDLIGVIEWKGNDGTSFSSAAKIDCFVEDTSVTADHMGGRLVFSTSADGSAVPTERLRITSTGQVRLNTAGTPAADLHVGGTGSALNAYFQTSRSSGAYHHYAIGNSGASLGYIGSAGQISASGGGTSFAVRSEGDLQFCAGGGTERLRINSSGKISLGYPMTTPPSWLHVKGNTYQTLRLENFDGGGNGPYIEMYTNSSSPAVNDYTGIFSFKNRNSAAEETTYSQIRTRVDNVTDGSETGHISFHTRHSGTFGERLKIASDGKTFIERTVSDTSGVHPALQIETTSSGTENSSFATGIDFFQDGIHKKRLAITKGNAGTGGGDWAFYKDQGNNVHTYMFADGDMSIVDGDLKIGTNGHGINFYPYDNASSNPGSDNNLLSDYERGTWVPADGSSGALTLTVTSASYVKVGELVFINFYVVYPTNSDGATAYLTGLPFTPKGSNNYSYLTGRIANFTNNIAIQVNAGSTSAHIYVGDSAYMNSQLSGKYILVSGCYSA